MRWDNDEEEADDKTLSPGDDVMTDGGSRNSIQN